MPKTTTRPAPKPTAEGFAEARAISAATKGTKAPKFAERTRSFYLAAHYSSWELVKTSEGWRLVPTLKRLVLQPGVNGTATPPKGQPASGTALKTRAVDRWDFQVLGNLEEYLVEVDGDGAPGIFLRWERVRVYQDGRWSISFDADGYDLWRWSLVQEGRVEAPREDSIDEIRRRLRRAVDRATRTPHLEVAKRALAEAEVRLKGLDEAVKALGAEPAAAVA